LIRGIRFGSDLESADFGEIDQLFRAAGLGSRDPERYRAACCRSYACVLAWDGGRIVGLGRLLSDGYVASAVFDMAVHPDYQGRGIGRRIMELLHEAVPRSTHILFAVPGREGFYRKMGYYDCKTGMIRPSDPEKAAEAGYMDLTD
jgi:ribosomal protein S18 acetylase RimI-like enzyme